ncbi:MAG TPA: BON domain-containing protein [Vitreimonas sp.]|uniref:BON domain-containing protein n=1 Tax=Vitreimonas sp. TaxID=3069702 RepID=UPI002D3DB1B1|nr:BON domain-containing protein [Vitreimonas sp.]HYD89287.1 BON domain-containing protein [Vitreimonas sp.]
MADRYSEQGTYGRRAGRYGRERDMDVSNREGARIGGAWRDEDIDDEYRFSRDDDYGRGYERDERFGRGEYRSREDRDREYGSSYGAQGPSFAHPRHGGGYGGYAETGQGYGQRSSYGPGYYGASEEQYAQGYGQGGIGYSAQGNWGQGGGLSGDFGREYGQGQGYRSTQQGYGGYGEPEIETGGFGNQTGWNVGGTLGQGRQGLNLQDFGGYEGSFGQGGYLTRGSRRQWGGHAGRGPKNYTRSDDRIREDVNDRLTDDPDVDASEIDVKVSNGQVTLAGTVDSRDEKRRAEDCAEAVSGVRDVQNNLRVQRSESSPRATSKQGRSAGDDRNEKMQ